MIQGPVAGPGLFTVFIDSLFRRIRLPVTAFVDNVQFVVNVTTLIEGEVQSYINIIALWAAENYMPLSLDKYGVLHCGKQQHPNNYSINGALMKFIWTAFLI